MFIHIDFLSGVNPAWIFDTSQREKIAILHSVNESIQKPNRCFLKRKIGVKSIGYLISSRLKGRRL